MAATPIAALNKTTHVSLLRILSPPFFPFSFGSFGIAEWRRTDTIRHFGRRRQRARSGLVAVPLFIVECRNLPYSGHGSGTTIRAPGFATTAEQIRRARWANPSQAHSHLQDPQKTGSIPGRKSRRTSTAT